jgi:hypothetical protein
LNTWSALGETLALLMGRSEVMFQRWCVAITAVWLGIGAIAVGQGDRATVQMRDGSKFEGRIEELTANGELFVRVSQHDQRKVPISSVALIDRVGGASGLPATELRDAAGSQHLLLTTNGSSVRGQLVAIRGGEGSANGDQPRTYVFRADGRDQQFSPDQIARIYVGSYPFASITGNTTAPGTPSDLSPGIDVPGAVRVRAAAGWVSTGLRVRRGEMISFNTTGEVQLSDNPGDRARSAGSTRTAAGAPIPNAAAGALIGRVGNSAPFGIGDQSSVPMPFDGVLFLAVNDDQLADNAGEFIVSVNRIR